MEYVMQLHRLVPNVINGTLSSYHSLVSAGTRITPPACKADYLLPRRFTARCRRE